jgi:hypothetical protein
MGCFPLPYARTSARPVVCCETLYSVNDGVSAFVTFGDRCVGGWVRAPQSDGFPSGTHRRPSASTCAPVCAFESLAGSGARTSLAGQRRRVPTVATRRESCVRRRKCEPCCCGLPCVGLGSRDDPARVRRPYPEATTHHQDGPRACYELERKSHRNADSTVGLAPLRPPFPAFLSRF